MIFGISFTLSVAHGLASVAFIVVTCAFAIFTEAKNRIDNSIVFIYIDLELFYKLEKSFLIIKMSKHETVVF